MEQTEFTLIGGPLDGDVHYFPEGKMPSEFTVPRQIKTPNDGYVIVDHHKYILQYMKAGTLKMGFYMAEDMKPEQMLQRLFQFYKRGK